MFWTTDDETLSTQATENQKNQDAPGASGSAGGGGSIKNLSTTVKSDKFKMPKLTKAKKSDFAKPNSSGTDFLPPKPKKSSYTFKKLLLRLQFLNILIQNAISELRLML